MKITFVMPGYVWVPGGSNRVVYEYANQLSGRGHEVKLIFPRSWNKPSSSSIKVYIRRKITDFRRIFVSLNPNWFSVDKNVECISVKDPSNKNIPESDAVIATQWFVAEYLQSYTKNKGAQIYLIHHHEAESGAPRDRVNATWRLNCHKFAVSNWTCEQGKIIGINDIYCIPNGIDHDLYKINTPIEDRSLRVAMAYIDKPIKDVGTGLSALSMVKTQFPQLEISLFGVGSKPDNLPSGIQYYRNKSHQFLVDEIYNKSSIFLCSSRVEGFCFTLAEAMACGCAAVSTDCGGIRDFAEHNVTALLSQPGDPNQLAKHLQFLLQKQDERIKFAKAGSQRIAEFSWSKSADKLEKFIAHAVQHK